MKNKILIILGLIFFAGVFIIACKHEIPHGDCSTNPIAITLVKTDASVNQNNGIIVATASGGTGFEYSLNGGAYTNNGNFTGLEPYTSYRVVAKNSWGCTDTAMLEIGVASTPNPCNAIQITISISKTDAAPNQSNGSITATAGPGTGFTYSLNNGAFQPGGNFTGLPIGNYTVTAKNVDGCTGTAQVTIGTNDPCLGVTVTVTTTKTDPTSGQSNGTITASATGGTGFTYSLNNGAFQTSGTFSGLATGNYTVTAKNSNGCTGLASVALGSTNPCTGVTITVSSTKVDPTAGQSNGSITATASGGTGFTYSLNNGAFQATGTFTGLAAGTYTVTAKSSQGCLGSTTVTLVGTNPCTNTVITVTSAIVNVMPCATPTANGKITVTATGSSGYTYNINNGAYQASNIFSNLAAGNFTIGVKDLNGCTKTATATVGTSPKGPLFTDVRTLITNRCSGSGCHMNGGNAAGYNFDNDCSIITAWSAIRNSCVNSNSMPKSPQPPLTAAEKLKITNWINAGHTYGN